MDYLFHNVYWTLVLLSFLGFAFGTFGLVNLVTGLL